jgi:hypothetical protein
MLVDFDEVEAAHFDASCSGKVGC